MKLKQIKVGIIFYIGDLKAFPKLRMEQGYVDMRTKIIELTEEAPALCSLLNDHNALEALKIDVLQNATICEDLN